MHRWPVSDWLGQACRISNAFDAPATTPVALEVRCASYERSATVSQQSDILLINVLYTTQCVANCHTQRGAGGLDIRLFAFDAAALRTHDKTPAGLNELVVLETRDLDDP